MSSLKMTPSANGLNGSSFGDVFLYQNLGGSQWLYDVTQRDYP